MSDKEILEQAIQKAIDGGWLPYFHEFDVYMRKETVVYQVYDASTKYPSVLFGAEAKGYIAYAGQYRMTLFDIIFNHKFSKALWGEEIVDVGVLTNSGWHQLLPKYEWHLSEMVRADDPIKYLGDSI